MSMTPSQPTELGGIVIRYTKRGTPTQRSEWEFQTARVQRGQRKAAERMNEDGPQV
jgi:hypothetical protein